MDILPYVYVFIIGFIGKFYDDITELYLVKHDRLLETIKTIWTTLILYFMFFMIQNQYDTYWMMFVWTFLPLVDWYAFTDDPYFFSIVLLITSMGIGISLNRGYLVNFHLGYFSLAFFLYCICAPITEFFNFELNGPIHSLLKDIGFFKNGDGYIFVEKPKEDLEVSYSKLITRCISISFLLGMIGLLFVGKYFTTNATLQEIFTSVIYLALCNTAYFSLSIFNQIYVLFFNKELLKIHQKNSKA